MTVTVLLTGRLAKEAHGRTRYEVDGPTVEAALQALPAAGVLLRGDELRPFATGRSSAWLRSTPATASVSAVPTTEEVPRMTAELYISAASA